MANKGSGSIISGIIWMFVLSVLLFWLPLLGPLVAGFVGGKKAGGVVNGILAVILPGLIFGILLFVLASALSGMPVLGAIAGAGGLILALAHVGPLLVGAIIGGALA
jgi:hypothetical protein